MGVTQICFLIIMLSLVVINESLRCKRLCAFIDMPLNSSIQVNACADASSNETNTQCSVYVEINYQRGRASGRLGIQNIANNDQWQTSTIVTFDSVISIIRYTCLTDDCDVTFLSDQFPLDYNFLTKNVSLIPQEINDLIYDLDNNASDISCNSNQNCSEGKLCQATFPINSTFNDIFDTNSTSASCFKPLKDYYSINITQTYSPNNTCASINEMTVRCNSTNCIRTQIANDVYDIIYDYVIIRTHSFQNTTDNETCIPPTLTGASFLVSSHGFIIFAIIVFLISL